MDQRLTMTMTKNAFQTVGKAVRAEGPRAPKSPQSPRRGRPKAEKKLNRRDAIIESAIELIGQRGFAEVTAAEIAAHAGVSLPLIWYHFKSKEDIRDHADEVVLSKLASLVPDVSNGLREKIETFAQDIAERPDLEHIASYFRLMLLDQGLRCFKAAAMMRDRVKHLFGVIDPATCSTKDRQREIMLISIAVGPLIFKNYFDDLYGVNIYDVDNLIENGKVQVDIVEILHNRKY